MGRYTQCRPFSVNPDQHVGNGNMDEIFNELDGQRLSNEDRQWLCERYRELRNQFEVFYRHQVTQGKMTREQSLETCKRAILEAIKMELSVRR